MKRPLEPKAPTHPAMMLVPGCGLMCTAAMGVAALWHENQYSALTKSLHSVVDETVKVVEARKVADGRIAVVEAPDVLIARIRASRQDLAPATPQQIVKVVPASFGKLPSFDRVVFVPGAAWKPDSGFASQLPSMDPSWVSSRKVARP